MENIRKKLLLMKLSMEAIIAIKVTSFRMRFKKNVEEYEKPCITEMLDEDSVIKNEYLEIEETKYDFEAEERKRMIEDIKRGQDGVRLLFRNPRFLMALIAQKTDIITLIVEQYHMEGKITDYTIDAILSTRYIKFTEEEKNKLSSLITIPVGFGTIGLS